MAPESRPSHHSNTLKSKEGSWSSFPFHQAAIKDLQSFISFVFSVSIFGASTFAVIIGQMADPAEIWKPNPPPFCLSTVRTLLATAWLLFIIALAVAGYSSSVLTIYQQGDMSDQRRARKWNRFGFLASVVLHVSLVLAFMLLSIALIAYTGTVGWVAVGVSSLAAVFVVGLSLFQSREL